LIRSLLHPPPSLAPPELGTQYHIYALTRHISSQAVRNLATEGENVTLVEGDLNSPASIRKIFENAKESENGGIWGVYVVLQYPGLGANADGEEAQGKMVADLALEYGVKAFVYSSACRAGPAYESEAKLSWKAKRNVELHCKTLGEKGLPWTIIRPGFFMENLEGFLGSISTAVLRIALEEEGTLGLIGSEDVGSVAAGILMYPETFRNKVVVAVSEFSTISQLEQSYQRALGKPIPAIPYAAAKALIKINKGTQGLIFDLRTCSKARKEGEYLELEEEVKAANDAFKMRTYEEWLVVRDQTEKGVVNTEGKGWNGLSLGKLLTGRV